MKTDHFDSQGFYMTPPLPMTKAEYMRFHVEFCERMKAITTAKNADYTGDSDDPFANFRLVEKLDVATAEQGILVRMSDKFARLTALTKPGAVAQVSTESIEDTLLDLANYSALLAGLLRSRRP